MKSCCLRYHLLCLPSIHWFIAILRVSERRGYPICPVVCLLRSADHHGSCHAPTCPSVLEDICALIDILSIMVAGLVPLGVECVQEGIHVYFDLSSIIVAIVLPLGIRVRTGERFVIVRVENIQVCARVPLYLRIHVLAEYHQSIYACIVSVSWDCILRPFTATLTNFKDPDCILRQHEESISVLMLASDHSGHLLTCTCMRMMRACLCCLRFCV